MEIAEIINWIKIILYIHSTKVLRVYRKPPSLVFDLVFLNNGIYFHDTKI